MLLSSLLSASLLSLLPTFVSAAATSTACNNSPDLCSRSYSNITQLGAHDSAFVRNDTTGWTTSGNQFFWSTTQLDAGVRLLSAQVHKTNTSGSDQWHLCHTSCDLLDAGTLEAWLSDIKTWLDNNPNDVVTLILVNSDGASASELEAQFSASGADSYAYAPNDTTTPPTTWPTLNEMISANTRLVTFVASLNSGDTSTYLLDEFTFVFENPYDVTSQTGFSCNPDRPSSLDGSTSAAASSGMLFMMNHLLYQEQLFGEVPYEDKVNETNALTGTGSLGVAVNNCTSIYGNAPWAVLVDFFNVGPAIESVDRANGVSGSTTGRTAVTTEVLSATSSSDAAGSSSSLLALVIPLAIAVFL